MVISLHVNLGFNTRTWYCNTWLCEGVEHRKDGPSTIYYNGFREFWQQGIFVKSEEKWKRWNCVLNITKELSFMTGGQVWTGATIRIVVNIIGPIWDDESYQIDGRNGWWNSPIVLARFETFEVLFCLPRSKSFLTGVPIWATMAVMRFRRLIKNQDIASIFELHAKGEISAESATDLMTDDLKWWQKLLLCWQYLWKDSKWLSRLPSGDSNITHMSIGRNIIRNIAESISKNENIETFRAICVEWKRKLPNVHRRRIEICNDLQSPCQN